MSRGRDELEEEGALHVSWTGKAGEAEHVKADDLLKRKSSNRNLVVN